VVTGGCGTATSNVASLTVNPPPGPPGDFDLDNDVDLEDFGLLQKCLAVADPSEDFTCAPADLNGDNIINGRDVALFRGCMSGSKIPANVSCTSGH
jgi:hypothetical protein